MRRGVLKEVRFKEPPVEGRVGLPCVHSRNGDSIEVHFGHPTTREATLTLGYSGGMEHAVVGLDFGKRKVSLRSSEWHRPQPVTGSTFRLPRKDRHVLRVDKSEGCGELVKMADFVVTLDGSEILRADDVDILPEIDVSLEASGVRVHRFVHRGIPSGLPETLHVGGWQMLNRPSIEENMASLFDGIERAADAGVELLVTPETSLTGLFPAHRVTQDRQAITRAERKLRQRLRAVRGAPYLVVGMPVWETVPGHRREETRYNVSRVYDPDGQVVLTGAKIHSCESEFWHGHRLQEFDIKGVPICMHICHDGRYPEVWTLPVMFGARVVLHPSNGGTMTGSIDALERGAGRSTTTSHAFYVHVNGGGGSYIAGPGKFDNVMAVSDECRRDGSSFPNLGEPTESLLQAVVPVGEAFGYWPTRSFRASEEIAGAYTNLYRAVGGKRCGSTTTRGPAGRGDG